MTITAIDPRQLLLPLEGLAQRSCATCTEAEQLLGAEPQIAVANRLGFQSTNNFRMHLKRHGRHELAAQYIALKFCDVCHEVRHLLGTDSLENVAQRLGYKDPAHLRVHLDRHGRIELARRFDLLDA